MFALLIYILAANNSVIHVEKAGEYSSLSECMHYQRNIMSYLEKTRQHERVEMQIGMDAAFTACCYGVSK